MTDETEDSRPADATPQAGRSAAAPNPIPEFWRNPGPQDKAIFVLAGLLVLVRMASMPFRVYFLNHPWQWVTFNGSPIGMIISGSEARVHHAGWWVPWLLGVFGAVYDMPLWWWMGRRWGREFIDTQLANYRFIDRHRVGFERWTLRYAPLVIFASFVPGVPIPLGLVVFILADAGMSLRRFLALTVGVLTVVQGVNLYLGYAFGQHVVDVVRTVNRYGTWVTLALVAWIVYSSMRRAAREQAAMKGRHAGPGRN